MNNRIDKLFRQNAGEHHLPNDGPKWDDLEKRMHGKKRRPFILFLIVGLFLMTLGITLTKLNDNNAKRVATKYPVSLNSTDPGNDKLNTQVKESNNINSNYSDRIINNVKAGNKVEEVKINSQQAKDVIKEKGKSADRKNEVNNNSIDESADKDQSIEKKSDSNVGKNGTPDENLNSTVVAKGTDTLSKKANETPVRTAIREPKVKKPFLPSLLGIYLNVCPSIIRSNDRFSPDSATHKSYSDYRSNAEKMRSGRCLNLGLQFSPFKRLSFSSGILYEERIEAVHYHFLRDEAPVFFMGKIAGYIHLTGSGVEKIDYDQNNVYKYIGIPLNVTYQFFETHRFGFGILLSGSYLRQISVQGKTLNKSTLELETLTNLNSAQLKSIFNSGLGLVMNYRVTSKFTFSLAPDLSTQVNKNIYASKARSASLNINLQYKIF